MQINVSITMACGRASQKLHFVDEKCVNGQDGLSEFTDAQRQDAINFRKNCALTLQGRVYPL